MGGWLIVVYTPQAWVDVEPGTIPPPGAPPMSAADLLHIEAGIVAEEAARIAGDGTNGAAVTAEATTRATADAGLAATITTNTTNIASNAAAITSEATTARLAEATAIHNTGAAETKTGTLTVPLLDSGGAVCNVMAFGAIGDGTSHPLSTRFATLAAAQAVYTFVTSLTSEIDWAACQLAVNLAAVLGGAVVRPAKAGFMISDTLVIPSGVGFHGPWTTGANTNTVPTNHGKLIWNGATNGTMISVSSATGVMFDGLLLDGNSVSGVTCLSIQGLRPPATAGIVINRWGCYNATTGIQLGNFSTSGQDYQVDQVHFGAMGHMYNVTYGIVVDSFNAMDEGIIGPLRFTTGTHAVWLKRCGIVKLRGIDAAGPTGTTPAAIRFGGPGLHAPTLIEDCETEQFGVSVWVDNTGGGNSNNPITMIGNVWGGLVQADAGQNFIGIGNLYSGSSSGINLNAAAVLYYDQGDQFIGGATITQVAGAQYFRSFPSPARAISATTVLTTADLNTEIIVTATSPITVTLPAPTSTQYGAPPFINIRVTPASTDLLTLATAGGNIDGQATRVMWSAETATVKSDGVNWVKTAGKTRPMTASMRQATTQPISTSVITAITLDTMVSDPTGLMVSTGTNRIVIKRPGKYQMVGRVGLGGLAANAARVITIVTQNGSNAGQSEYAGLAGTNPASLTLGELPAAAVGDTIGLQGFQTSGATVNTFISSPPGAPYLQVTEIPSW